MADRNPGREQKVEVEGATAHRVARCEKTMKAATQGQQSGLCFSDFAPPV